MFAENGKYGQAKHMSSDSVFAAGSNGDIGVSRPAIKSVLHSLRKYSSLGRKQEVIEISLDETLASRMIQKGVLTAQAANENRRHAS
ncbi:MAG: hypothetical protein EP348_07940 [Alphaproteobacteria bacterium]|nr:MAG: hypothetical protein EP348_07940 [Alphaproteobacteria bacterium]